MEFKMIHENYNVSDLDRSIKFYNEALDLHEVRRKTTDDFIIVYLSNDVSDFELELTWLKDHPQPYNLGECEFHLAFKAEDYEAAHKKHEEMGCISSVASASSIASLSNASCRFSSLSAPLRAIVRYPRVLNFLDNSSHSLTRLQKNKSPYTIATVAIIF